MLINSNVTLRSLTPPKSPVNSSRSESQESVASQSLPSELATFGSVPPRIQSLNPQSVALVEQDLNQGEYVEGEVIVKLRSGQLELLGDFASEYGGQVVERFDIPSSIYKSFDGDLVRIKLPQGITTAEAIAAMKDDERVVYAESNDILQFTEQAEPQVPNDLHEKLWGFKNNGQTGGKKGADASILDAWKVTVGDKSEQGPLIAILDSGADMDHPDLVGNFWVNPGEIPGDGIDNDGNGVIDDVHGYDAGDDDGSPDDQVGHGTHVAGTIGAVGNNGEGVTGVNQNARLMPIRIDSGGRITTDGVVRGLMYATKMGADITNNSWGGSRLNQAIEDAFKAAPALHIAAAGNDGVNTDRTPFYPMAFDIPNMVAVGATDHNDRKAGFSNFGAKNVDVTAPGADIYSTKNGGGYRLMSGTSMASPFVAGVAGLIKSAYPEATPTEIRERLIYGSDPITELSGMSVSNGRVNAAKALENDAIAPGAPNDFWGQETTFKGTTLRWTSTGDDKWEGRSSASDLRVSTSPIDPDSFSLSETLATSAPGETGHLETVRFERTPSLEPQTYHFALQVVDNVGNRSELRTTSVTIPAAQIALEDGFDSEISSWQGDGAWGRLDVPGRGKVWTDSPNGTIAPDSKTSLTSPTISLKETSGNLLTFDSKHDVGILDKVRVQVSSDGGKNWSDESLIAGSGNRRSDWKNTTLDLSKFDGQDVKVRFAMEGGQANGRAADGFYLDNLKILGQPTSPG